MFAVTTMADSTPHFPNLTCSERCARLLLAAWNTGDLAGLEAALRQASDAQGMQLSSNEEERMELVREIAGGIQMWLRGVRRNQPADLNTHLDLLRHLARHEGVREKSRVAPRAVAAREVPRLEMLVSGLN